VLVDTILQVGQDSSNVIFSGIIGSVSFSYGVISAGDAIGWSHLER
jgi:hypothetical protein